MLNSSTLQQFLRDRIPLSTAMGVEVLAVFGGSSSALAILSAWGLLFLRLGDEFPETRHPVLRVQFCWQRKEMEWPCLVLDPKLLRTMRRQKRL